MLRAFVTDPALRATAIRLTVASTGAMAFASMLSLQNPWWAAMAVWMIGQPPRGLLVERCAAQLVGTLLGAAIGAAIVLMGAQNPAASLVGLAVWIATCCGVANAMRHQRAYGAVLCGLTSAVIVSLTLGTQIDPWTFALARGADNLIGIGASLLVSMALGSPKSGPSIPDRARAVTADALDLVAAALGSPGMGKSAIERDFLLALATLEASAEDAAAGSLAGRRKLRDLNTLLAFLLDLIVMARAIRAREAPPSAPGHAATAHLRQMFLRAAVELRAGNGLDVRAIASAARALEAADPLMSPVIGEMRILLGRLADGYARLDAPEGQVVPRPTMAHPDVAGLRLAVVRGALAVFIAGGAWSMIDWDPLRYLVLGTCIFTVLFAAADEPVPAVRQVFIGGLCAAATALLWREGVVPNVASGWISLALAVPIVFAAAMVQAARGTAFVGLAFNMLFAVLARPVDLASGAPSVLVGIEAMLLSGIALSYVSYRWLIPMDVGRRRGRIRTSIRKEVAAISIRAATPMAERHLARLRFLVFSMAIRSRADVKAVDDALASLSLGHVLYRLGKIAISPSTSKIEADIIRKVLRLASAPIEDPEGIGRELRLLAAGAEMDEQTKWLLGLASRDLSSHPSSFVIPASRV
ncbi:FUSC family protein [Aurantimonas sp. 22II-16-19i]|uniref:FUSC family protein n=1 Tax=Aurantimonas sp. 22II-16-19i TaxID=1317114 RepID=UPI001FDAB26B|nr:FUSC family protein [Aurantimonas sp. 22II-16-19i]